MHLRFLIPLVFAIPCFNLFDATQAGEPRKWTSADGKFSVVGEMIGFVDDVVVIEKEANSGTIRVPMAKLSQADQDFAKEFKRKALGMDPPADGTVKAGPGDKWTLNAQIQIGLAPNTTEWTVAVKDPARFVAKSQQNPLHYVSVECLPFMSSRQARISHINQAIDSALESLRKVGAKVEKEPERITDYPPKRYETKIAGQMKDGTRIDCRLVVRFDLEGCITVRALGDETFALAAIDTSNQLTYVNPAKVAQTTMPKAEAVGRVPADKTKALSAFIADIKKKLNSGDVKGFIQATIDPADLEQILKSTTLDELAKVFEGEKKRELQSVLEGLDWKVASYDKEKKQVVFKRPDDRPIYFVETADGWRLKN